MRYIGVLIAAIVCVSCSMKATPAVQASAQPSRGEVISRIVQRRDMIVVRAGAGGATYSLESRGGKILVGEMTLGELARSEPGMYRAIKTMEANVVWAGE